MSRRSAALLTLLLVLSVMLGFSPRNTLAAATPAGYKDGLFGSAPGDDPTADKPQSKLWYNDGFWWAVMFNQSAGNWRIYKLTWPSAWSDTGIVVDTRATSRADVLWDGNKLFIASLVRFSSSNQALLSRYSYNVSSDTYSLDAPAVAIMTGSAETLALDKDTTGRLWIAYTQAKKVYVNTSDATGTIWGTPFQLPGSSAVGSDDIASLVAYKDQTGPSVGVLWSSHSSSSSASAMYFARHTDSDAPGTWKPVEQIYGGVGSCLADDHINLKSLQDDPSTGALFAAVKTSAGDSGCPSGATDAIMLVVRNPNNTWKWTTFGTTTDNHTRPLVLLDSDNRKVYMFATSPTSCGTIYMKSTSMANPSFASGLGTSFISASGACINNATSTKQPVGNSSGLVVLASDQTNKFYYHNVLSLGSPPADTTPPTVSSTTPANSATNISTGTSVTASFSEPIDASTVTGANFTLTGPSGVIAASVSYNSGTNTAALQPNAALAASTSYTARISGVQDVAGNTLASTYSWAFTTAAATPPGTSFTFGPVVDTYVSQASPTSNYATNNQLQVVGGSSSAKQVFIRFNVSGLPAGAAVSSAKLRLYVTNDSTSGGVFNAITNTSWAENITWNTKPAIDGPQLATLGVAALNSTVEVDLTSAIGGNGSYSFAIGLPNANTNTLAYASREYSTVASRPQLIVTTSGSAPADTTPPTVGNVTPANGTANIDTGTSVTATFSEPLDASTVISSNFTLAGPSGAVAASVSYNSGTNTATLQPSVALIAGTSYSAQIVGVKDVAGNVLASAYNWSFSTAAASPNDTTPPTVIATSPVDSATGVSVATSVTASFSEAMNAGTLSGATFLLRGPSGPVAATVSYNAAGKIATLIP
ncbi:MAG: Ig-like domain-containing protein, partial [Roseiflexaceae bacterium]